MARWRQAGNSSSHEGCQHGLGPVATRQDQSFHQSSWIGESCLPYPRVFLRLFDQPKSARTWRARRVRTTPALASNAAVESIHQGSFHLSARLSPLKFSFLFSWGCSVKTTSTLQTLHAHPPLSVIARFSQNGRPCLQRHRLFASVVLLFFWTEVLDCEWAPLVFEQRRRGTATKRSFDELHCLFYRYAVFAIAIWYIYIYIYRTAGGYRGYCCRVEIFIAMVTISGINYVERLKFDTSG